MNKLRLILCIAAVALPVSCATNIFPTAPYNAEGHRSAMEEWTGHAQTKEWWYATGILFADDGRKFLYQFTIFHGYRFGSLEGFSLHLALTDFRTGRHYFLQSNGLPGETIFAADSATVYRDSSISAEKDAEGNMARMIVRAKARDFSFSLDAGPLKGPVWHGDKGIVVMGHEAKTRERSFYYSYTRMYTRGSLEVKGKSYAVEGTSWFDRQWGQFRELYWEWFSFRLNDRREIMIFRFPDTGYTAGTMINGDGSYRPLGEIEIAAHNPETYIDGKHTYQLGWKLNVEGEEFTVVPLLENQSNAATGLPSYWEGLCTAYDPEGNDIGWCVVESTSPVF